MNRAGVRVNQVEDIFTVSQEPKNDFVRLYPSMFGHTSIYMHVCVWRWDMVPSAERFSRIILEHCPWPGQNRMYICCKSVWPRVMFRAIHVLTVLLTVSFLLIPEKNKWTSLHLKSAM